MSDKTNSFSNDLNELEAIVEWFESEEPDLDEALVKFERGMELAANLKKRLDIVENKVVRIKRKFSEAESGDNSDA